MLQALSPKATRVLFLAITGVGLIYANSLNAPFYFDDYQNILLNEAIRIEKLDWAQLKKLVHENFLTVRQPLYITFGINYVIGGYHPFGYHIFNILLHILNTWLVFVLAFRTLSLPSLNFSRDRAFSAASMTALLWALHPIQTNAAVYIVQRTASMAAMFFLISFIAYIQGRLCLEKSLKSSLPWFFFAIVSGSLALMCKRNTVFLPFLVFVYDCFFFPAKNLGKKVLWGLVCSGSLLLLVFLFSGGSALLREEMLIYQWRDFTLKERLLTEMRVVFHYLGLLLIPGSDRLTLYYDGYPISRSFFNPWTTAASFFGLVFLGMSLFWAILSKRFIYAFGILWYFVNLAVESTIFCLELVFEHRAYLPSVGIFLIISVWISRLNLLYPRRRPVITCLLLLFMLFEIFGTLLRNDYWSHKAVFYEDALEKSAKPSRILGNISLLYTDLGAYGLARECLEKALDYEPDNISILAYYALLFKTIGKKEEAEEVFDRIDHLLEKNRYNLMDTIGINLLATQFTNFDKDYKKGLRYIKYVGKRIKPFGYDFRLGLGYLNTNQPEKALECFKKAMEERRHSAKYHFFMGLTYRILGRHKEAIPFIERTLQLSPSSSLNRKICGIMKTNLWKKFRPQGFKKKVPMIFDMDFPERYER